MTKQPELFDIGSQSMTGRITITPALAYAPDPPAQHHSRTSVEAGVAIKPCTGRLRQRVLEYIQSCGPSGATDEECQLALAMPGSTQRPRRWELAQARLITQAGTRCTTSGRVAQVWAVEN